MKGLILAGGKGTRLRPITFTHSKQLIPIANKANLYYVIEDLVAAGILEIGIIISPETGEEVKKNVGNGSRWGAKCTYILQEQPLGLAHALKTAKTYLNDSPFVMYLGDNLLSGGIAHLIKEYERGQVDSIVLLTPVDNPHQFGVAVLDDEGRVVRLVEKPKQPPSNLALVGVYLFNPVVHDVIAGLKPSFRGEYEITDAIQGLLDRNLRVVARHVRGWWKDTGKPEDLLDANRLVLSQIGKNIQGTIDNSQLVGEVIVESGTRIINSVIRGPVHIDHDTLIQDSYIGPYTSIGGNVRIIGSEVEYSIVFQEATLEKLPYRLDESIVGKCVMVKGHSNDIRRNTLKIVLGDHSQIQL